MTVSPFENNRSFLYGDGFFETFLLQDGICRNFALHYERILHSHHILKLNFNPHWTKSFFEKELFLRSHEFNDSVLKVRITFYREAPGTYLPKRDTSNFEIQIKPYHPIEKAPLLAGVYPEAQKPVNIFSEIKSTSALLYVMAARFAHENNWDEAIILNEYGRVCEGVYSNIFLKRDNTFFTPPISEGCVNGVFRKSFVLTNNQVKEQKLSIEDLQNGEVFFSNSVRGMLPGKLIL